MKAGALALALGALTWILAPILLPRSLPEDFPKLPELRQVNPTIRAALESADKQARRHPESAEAMGTLAMSYHANLFLAQAGRAYRIAARLAPGDAQWAYAQAFLEEEKGDEAGEFQFLEQTLRLQPGHLPALLKMADAQFKLDRLDDAAQYYAKAAQAGGTASLQPSFGLARVAARRSDWKKVIEYASPLTNAYPLLQPPYELLQEAYAAMGQASLAAEARRGMAASRSKVVPPLEDPFNQRLIDLCYSSTRLLKQAGLLSHLGYPDRALDIAHRAAHAEPSDPDVHNFIARTLLASRPEKPEAVDEALTELADCVRLRPADPVPLWMFAQDFFDGPKAPAAVERLRGLMQPYANRSDAHFYLGMVADARGEIAEALSQYQAALKSDPENSGVYNKLGVALDKAGQLDQAIECFQKSVTLNSRNATARFNLGAGLLQRGKDAQGWKELAAVLELKPDYAPAHFCMAFACLYAKKPVEAAARFREGLRYMPADPEAHFGLASALSQQRKREDAVAELREALRLRPNYPEALDLLGRIDH